MTVRDRKDGSHFLNSRDVTFGHKRGNSNFYSFGMIGFIRLYERDRMCTCFRDRFEILAGAYLQWFLGIPVAHSWW